MIVTRLITACVLMFIYVVVLGIAGERAMLLTAGVTCLLLAFDGGVAIVRRRAAKLSSAEAAVLIRLHKDTWLYPGDVDPNAVTALFRRNLIRREGDGITLTDKGKEIMSAAQSLADSES